jgi:hypothetical protein
MPGDPAYPIEYYVDHAEEIFGVPPGAVSGALEGGPGSLTVGEATRILIVYLGRIVTASPPPEVQRVTFLVGDGSSTSFTIPHMLGVRAPTVTVYDLSQTPPAEIGVEVQQGIDFNHIILSAAAWETEPPAEKSIEVTVIA